MLARVYEELFAELGHPLTTDEYYEHLAGHTDEEMFTRWLGAVEPRADRRTGPPVQRARLRRLDGRRRTCAPRSGWAAERMPVAVVSARSATEIEPVLARVGSPRRSSRSSCRQDDVTRGKPDPQPYLLAAERLGVPPRGARSCSRTRTSASRRRRRPGRYVVGLTRTLGADAHGGRRTSSSTGSTFACCESGCARDRPPRRFCRAAGEHAAGVRARDRDRRRLHRARRLERARGDARPAAPRRRVPDARRGGRHVPRPHRA